MLASIINKHYAKLIAASPLPTWVYQRDKLLANNKLATQLLEQQAIAIATIEDKQVVSIADKQVYRFYIHENADIKFIIAQNISVEDDYRQKLQSLADITEIHDVIEAIPTALMLLDQEHNVKLLNSALVSMFKLSEEQKLKIKNFHDAISIFNQNGKTPAFYNIKDFIKQNNQQLKTLLEKHQSLWHLPSEKTLRVTYIPYGQSDILCIFEDITDALNLKNENQTLVDIQRSILDNLQEGVALIGTDSKVNFYNKEWFNIFCRQPLELGTPIDIWLASVKKFFPKYQPFWQTFSKRLIMATTEIKQQQHGHLKFLQDQIISYYITPLQDGTTLVSVSDVSSLMRERKSWAKQNKLLAERSRLRASFLEEVAFHLRSPISSLKGYVYLAENSSGEQQANYFSYLNKACQEIEDIESDIMDLISIRSGDYKPKLVNCDLEAVLKEASVADGHKIKVSVKTQNTGSVITDPNLIKLMVRHFLRYYGKLNGKYITVDTIYLYDKLTLTFIIPSRLDLIQMGLLIIRDIINMLGGRVDVDEKNKAIYIICTLY
jgi:PAS domain-containing protein